jgi:nucleotide-binding universal stress UspA family protein
MMSVTQDAHVLVGYDGSPESAAALRWAVDEARMRSLSITVGHVWHWPYAAVPENLAARTAVRQMAEQTAEAGAAVVAVCAPQRTVRTRTVSGPTAEMLMALSRDAEMTVVGHRGVGGFAELPVGSVALQLAAHADRPVMVVREPIAASESGKRTGDVVAGIDGSAASDAVLAFAMEEAALRRVPLTAVCSWWDAAEMPVSPVIETEELRRKVAVRFEHLLALWREKYPYVAVRASLVSGPPRTALLAGSQAACLLVIGRHGRGDTPGLLGLVGQAVVHGAACPVAVVGPA